MLSVYSSNCLLFMDKDKITKALNDLKLEPERYKKLQSLALSQMTDSQKHSPVYLSIQDLKMREIMAKYCK